MTTWNDWLKRYKRKQDKQDKQDISRHFDENLDAQAAWDACQSGFAMLTAIRDQVWSNQRPIDETIYRFASIFTSLIDVEQCSRAVEKALRLAQETMADMETEDRDMQETNAHTERKSIFQTGFECADNAVNIIRHAYDLAVDGFNTAARLCWIDHSPYILSMIADEKRLADLVRKTFPMNPFLETQAENK